MDFDAEIAKFLGQPSMKTKIKTFTIQQIRSRGTGGIVVDSSGAMEYAKKARDAIVDALPIALKRSQTRGITTADLIISEPTVNADGDFEITMSWSDAVHRDSLYPAGYPEGLHDVVALFSHGYTAKKYVRGIWRGKRYISRRSRPADPFIRDTISKFNAMYAKDNVKLVLDTHNY